MLGTQQRFTDMEKACLNFIKNNTPQNNNVLNKEQASPEDTVDIHSHDPVGTACIYNADDFLTASQSNDKNLTRLLEWCDDKQNRTEKDAEHMLKKIQNLLRTRYEYDPSTNNSRYSPTVKKYFYACAKLKIIIKKYFLTLEERTALKTNLTNKVKYGIPPTSYHWAPEKPNSATIYLIKHDWPTAAFHFITSDYQKDDTPHAINLILTYWTWQDHYNNDLDPSFEGHIMTQLTNIKKGYIPNNVLLKLTKLALRYSFDRVFLSLVTIRPNIITSYKNYKMPKRDYCSLLNYYLITQSKKHKINLEILTKLCALTDDFSQCLFSAANTFNIDVFNRVSSYRLARKKTNFASLSPTDNTPEKEIISVLEAIDSYNKRLNHSSSIFRLHKTDEDFRFTDNYGKFLIRSCSPNSKDEALFEYLTTTRQLYYQDNLGLIRHAIRNFNTKSLDYLLKVRTNKTELKLEFEHPTRKLLHYFTSNSLLDWYCFLLIRSPSPNNGFWGREGPFLVTSALFFSAACVLRAHKEKRRINEAKQNYELVKQHCSESTQDYSQWSFSEMRFLPKKGIIYSEQPIRVSNSFELIEPLHILKKQVEAFPFDIIVAHNEYLFQDIIINHFINVNSKKASYAAEWKLPRPDNIFDHPFKDDNLLQYAIKQDFLLGAHSLLDHFCSMTQKLRPVPAYLFQEYEQRAERQHMTKRSLQRAEYMKAFRVLLLNQNAQDNTALHEAIINMQKCTDHSQVESLLQLTKSILQRIQGLIQNYRDLHKDYPSKLVFLESQTELSGIINATNTQGNTALHLAVTLYAKCQNGEHKSQRTNEVKKQVAKELISLLLKHGADKMSLNKKQLSPLGLAYKNDPDNSLKSIFDKQDLPLIATPRPEHTLTHSPDQNDQQPSAPPMQEVVTTITPQENLSHIATPHSPLFDQKTKHTKSQTQLESDKYSTASDKDQDHNDTNKTVMISPKDKDTVFLDLKDEVARNIEYAIRGLNSVPSQTPLMQLFSQNADSAVTNYIHKTELRLKLDTYHHQIFHAEDSNELRNTLEEIKKTTSTNKLKGWDRVCSFSTELIKKYDSYINSIPTAHVMSLKK